MGLGVRRQHRGFTSLLCSVAVALVGASCVNTEPEKIVEGEEVPMAELEAALNWLEPKRSPLEIELGDFVQQTVYLNFIGLPGGMISQSHGITVIHREDFEDRVELASLQETQRYVDNQPTESFLREHFEVLRRERAPAPQSLGFNLNLKVFESDWKRVLGQADLLRTRALFNSMFSGRSQNRAKFMNLRTETKTIEPPPLMRRSFSGLIEIRELSVDFVDGETRISFFQQTTDDLHFLASRFLDCQQAPIRIEGRNMLIQQCRRVDDFQRGSDQRTP